MVNKMQISTLQPTNSAVPVPASRIVESKTNGFTIKPLHTTYTLFYLGVLTSLALFCQVPETLPDEVLAKMSAPPKSDVPIITPNQLAEADGLIFGFPTRFGMMTAQFKAFLDATGGLWRTQQLAGKPAGIFYSTGSQGGGQETTP